MNIVATVDRNWGISKGGNSLVSIPSERALLREETLGKVIVADRAVFAALNGGQALPGRKNIVICGDESFRVKNVLRFADAAACTAYLQTEGILFEEVFVLGGAGLYADFLPYCKLAHITAVDFVYEAGAFLHNLDADADWELRVETEEETYFDLAYTFKLYQNTRK